MMHSKFSFFHLWPFNFDNFNCAPEVLTNEKKTLNRLCWCSHFQRIRYQVCCNTSCVSTTPKSVHLKIAKIKAGIESIAERFWCTIEVFFFPRRIVSDVRRKVSWTQQMHFVKIEECCFYLVKNCPGKAAAVTQPFLSPQAKCPSPLARHLQLHLLRNNYIKKVQHKAGRHWNKMAL